MLEIEDMEILSKYSFDRDIAVDLGTFKGMSAGILSKNAKRVVTFDVFEDTDLIEDDAHRKLYKIMFDAEPHFYKDIKVALSCYKNIEVVKGKSTNPENVKILGNDWGNIDLLFVDDDHSFNGVKNVIGLWYSGVKSGGAIIFHDSYPRTENTEPVCKFLDTIDTADMEMLEQKGRSSVYIKK